MAQTPDIPDMFNVSPQAAAAARAALTMDLTPPDDAKKSTDKNNVEHVRWTEFGTVESAWRQGTKKGPAILLKVGVRFRPDQPNKNKMGWFQMTLHPGLVGGGRVSDEDKEKYGMLTDRNLAVLFTLLDVTGFSPADGSPPSGALLKTLFPEKERASKSPLAGKKVAVKIHQKPTTMADSTRQYDIEAELFMPAPEVEAPKAPTKSKR